MSRDTCRSQCYYYRVGGGLRHRYPRTYLISGERLNKIVPSPIRRISFYNQY